MLEISQTQKDAQKLVTSSKELLKKLENNDDFSKETKTAYNKVMKDWKYLNNLGSSNLVWIEKEIKELKPIINKIETLYKTLNS